MLGILNNIAFYYLRIWQKESKKLKLQSEIDIKDSVWLLKRSAVQNIQQLLKQGNKIECL